MKEQQPDKIFREKLAGYQRPVSSNAWDRVETAMERKAFPWMRAAVAASLLLICGVAATLWLRDDTSQVTVASNDQLNATQPKNNEATIAPESQEEKKSTQLDSVANDRAQDRIDNKVTRDFPIESKEKENKPKAASDRKRVNAVVHDTPSIAQHDNQANEKTAEKDPDSIVEEQLQTSEPIFASNENSQPANNAQESVTIVISAEETLAYVNKNVKGDATPEEKKTSTLKKVLKKASELKNNDQDPIGDLRQMKDELLALNFKSDKRGQNK